MSADWVKKKRLNWPTGSKGRFLKDIGAESLIEAVLKKKPEQDQTAAQAMKYHQDYAAMKEIIEELKLVVPAVFDNVSVESRKRLASMNVTTLLEARLWRDSWLKEVEKVKA